MFGGTALIINRANKMKRSFLGVHRCGIHYAITENIDMFKSVNKLLTLEPLKITNYLCSVIWFECGI